MSAPNPWHRGLRCFWRNGDLALRSCCPPLPARPRWQLPAGPRISRPHAPDSTSLAIATVCAASCAVSSPTAPSTADPRPIHRSPGLCEHDFADPEDWHPLTTLLPADPGKVRVFDLACAPSLFGRSPRSGHRRLFDASSRCVLEKPIGRDLASARAINDAVGAVFAESQIFRIDHYLGKESVQNLLVTRFANTSWNRCGTQLDRPRADHGRRSLAWAPAAGTTTPPARCATCCKTTCCKCCAWSPWNRPPTSTAKPSATRSSRSCRRSSR